VTAATSQKTASIAWDPIVGRLSFTADMSPIELLAVLELAQHALVRQMAAGPIQPTGGVAIQAAAPGYRVRRVDRDAS